MEECSVAISLLLFLGIWIHGHGIARALCIHQICNLPPWLCFQATACSWWRPMSLVMLWAWSTRRTPEPWWPLSTPTPRTLCSPTTTSAASRSSMVGHADQRLFSDSVFLLFRSVHWHWTISVLSNLVFLSSIQAVLQTNPTNPRHQLKVQWPLWNSAMRTLSLMLWPRFGERRSSSRTGMYCVGPLGAPIAIQWMW